MRAMKSNHFKKHKHSRVSVQTASGQDYNFISNTMEKKVIAQREMLKNNPNLVKRQATISKFSEIGGLACPKYNPEYAAALKAQPHMHNNVKGGCQAYALLAHSYIKAFRMNSDMRGKIPFEPNGRNYGAPVRGLPKRRVRPRRKYYR